MLPNVGIGCCQLMDTCHPTCVKNQLIIRGLGCLDRCMKRFREAVGISRMNQRCDSYTEKRGTKDLYEILFLSFASKYLDQP